MVIKAVISYFRQNNIFLREDIVETIDITSCVFSIQDIYLLAEKINKYPQAHSQVAQAMTYKISLVYKALKPQIDLINNGGNNAS